MKGFLCSLILFSATQSYCQTDIVCQGLTDKTKNIFYIGIDNPIRILRSNISENYSVTISSGAGTIGTVDKISKDEFIVRVNSVGKCTVIISEKNKQVFQKEFDIYTIPEAIVTLGGFHNTTMSTTSILVNPFLAVLYPNFYFKLNEQRVVAFHATFINGHDSVLTITTGNQLINEQINIIKNQSQSGMKIYFDNIRVSGLDDQRYSPFWIKIE